MVEERPDQARKGRGAISNRSGRYETERRVAVCDGWENGGWENGGWESGGDGAADGPEAPRLNTVLGVDTSRTIITSNQSPDVPFKRSINPYRGCEHGCIYCFARPSHAWLGLSPGLDFETKLFWKPEAPVLLAQELRAVGYVPETIALGANTDPYQPIERELRLTRSILEVLTAFRHPFGIITKSALVQRDIDLLAEPAARGLVQVSISVTTLDRDLARRMEPRAATPERRLDTIRALSAAGIPVAVLVSPMIPGLNDHELETILERAAAAGAGSANTILVRLPLEIADLFREWLETHAPHRADRVLSLIRQCREGGLNQAAFGVRMRGTGPVAALLGRRFALAVRRLGLTGRGWQLDTTQFRPPPAPGDQLVLL